MQKPALKSKSTQNERQKQTTSMGYPILEALLEENTPDFSGMLARHQQLLDTSKVRSGSLKEKAAAKTAALAYDKFFDLFSTLLKVKQKMIEDQKALQKTKSKK